MIYHSCYQSIVQGLRESGVFSSAISSAQTRSKGSLLSSFEAKTKNNYSTVISNSGGSGSQSISESSHTRTGGREIQTSARKILEVADNSVKAIPPLSPPGLDELHTLTWETNHRQWVDILDSHIRAGNLMQCLWGYVVRSSSINWCFFPIRLSKRSGSYYIFLRCVPGSFGSC